MEDETMKPTYPAATSSDCAAEPNDSVCVTEPDAWLTRRSRRSWWARGSSHSIPATSQIVPWLPGWAGRSLWTYYCTPWLSWGARKSWLAWFTWGSFNANARRPSRSLGVNSKEITEIWFSTITWQHNVVVNGICKCMA